MVVTVATGWKARWLRENGLELGENLGDVGIVVSWTAWYVATGYFKEQMSPIEVLNLLVCWTSSSDQRKPWKRLAVSFA